MFLIISCVNGNPDKTLEEFFCKLYFQNFAPNFAAFFNSQESNKELKEAIKFSRDFYNLVLKEVKPSSTLSVYLDSAVRNSKLPGEVLAWYNGMFWNIIRLEDASLGKPAISPALQDLRRFMYALVKEHDDGEVMEYGRTPLKNFDVAKVIIPTLLFYLV